MTRSTATNGFPKSTTVQRARSNGLGDLPGRTASRMPDKLAIVDGATTFTFAEWSATVDALAAGLRERGLRKGDRLAILSHNCWQFAALSFATARLGVILVPINYMLNADEIAYILDHSEPTALVVEPGLRVVASTALRQSGHRLSMHVILGETSDDWRAFDDLMALTGDTPPDIAVDDDDPVRLMYTSGTESRPKGALLSSRSLLWQYVSVLIEGEGSADDVELHALPLYHCAQMDCFLGPDVYIGATSVIARRPDADTLLELIEKHRITKFFAPPTVWISLLNSPRFAQTDLSSLRKGYYGASAMPVEVLAKIQKLLPDLRLWNFYGQTEMAPLATILKPEEQDKHAGAAGRPALNVETRVVDADDHPLPAGEVGEIVHRSPHATLGYYRDADNTETAFRNGWFHSGDLGVFDDDGVLRVVDRKKDMIKSGGENVASREVEEMLYTMDGIAEVAVFGVPDPVWIEAVAAVVVCRDGYELTSEQIVAYARDRMAGFKAPKYVDVVDDLPKNPSGKILKRVLRDEYLAATRVDRKQNGTAGR